MKILFCTSLGAVCIGSGHLKMAVRLHNNRLQLFYPASRLPSQPLQVVEMKAVPVFDGDWHTVVVSVTAHGLMTRTDCRKRKQRRVRRPFPARIDIRSDEVHIATCGRRVSERFRVALRFVTVLLRQTSDRLQCSGHEDKISDLTSEVKTVWR